MNTLNAAVLLANKRIQASRLQEVKEQQLMKSQIGVIRLQIDQLAQQVAELCASFSIMSRIYASALSCQNSCCNGLSAFA